MSHIDRFLIRKVTIKGHQGSLQDNFETCVRLRGHIRIHKVDRIEKGWDMEGRSTRQILTTKGSFDPLFGHFRADLFYDKKEVEDQGNHRVLHLQSEEHEGCKLYVSYGNIKFN